MSNEPTIIYTLTDEAPALATAAFLPVIRAFAKPAGVAVDQDGNVYVADTWNHRLQKFDPQGKFLLQWGTFGNTQGSIVGGENVFYGPRDMAIDAAGDLYVTDTGNKRVMKFSADGQFLGQWGGFGFQRGQFPEPVGSSPAGGRYLKRLLACRFGGTADSLRMEASCS